MSEGIASARWAGRRASGGWRRGAARTGAPTLATASRRPSRRSARGAPTRGAAAARTEHVATAETRQIGATAAMLAIPLMQESEAKALAEAEGVVCHLTSLVLVDEAGARHEGLPAVRKVALVAPAMARAMAMPVGMLAPHDAPSAAPSASRSTGRAGILRRYLTGGGRARPRRPIPHTPWGRDTPAFWRGGVFSP